MCKYFCSILAFAIVLTSCNTESHHKKSLEAVERDFNQFHYIYHFLKEEFEATHSKMDSYKPKVYDITGTASAKILNGDSVIRFVYRSLTGKFKGDSSIGLFKRVRLADKDTAMIPSRLFGCNLLGVYNSMNEDLQDGFYFCFYTNDQDDLLKVVHLYKPGNVDAAFFYTKDSINPMTRYKNEVPRLLAAERPLNLTDTVRVILNK